MASDPNRDLLPVKDNCCRTGKVSSEKFNHQILGKLSRCELEDRFLRLLDEQTHIKKLANCQEEKIKRLGTKLLRLLSERKNGRSCSVQGKESEELNLRVIELEHENYALKDKNTVLKQQLASHSRHLSHRSPARSNHTSPIMSIRQSAPQTQSEIGFDTGAKNGATDVQLQEAESHIRALNEEIKYLHNKIDILQQNLEKSSLDSRKVKVTENIELIRLQRSLKQQAIQIAALQAQVKNSETCQKVLKEELMRAHKDNDEALHLISEKQNEILNLCSKLEEKNLNRLEETELKERINDLVRERDCLKERSELLMKTIAEKSEESEKVNELKQLLAEEKRKKEKLEEALEGMRKCIDEKSSQKCPDVAVPQKETPKDSRCQGQEKEKEKVQQPVRKESVESTEDNFQDSDRTFIKVKCGCNCGQESNSNPEPESDTEEKVEAESSEGEGRYAAEKMKLERELQYLREMLRSQTCRCEAQQAEISRLMYELKLNEEKCNKTLRRLDMHLTIFEQLEMRSRHCRVNKSAGEPVRLKSETAVEKPAMALKHEHSGTEPEVLRSREVVKGVSDDKKLTFSTQARRYSSEGSLKLQPASREQLNRRVLANTPSSILLKEDSGKKDLPSEPKKRFVDQTFLDSSDEEQLKDENYERDSFTKKLQELEKSTRERNIERDENKSKMFNTSKPKYQRISSESLFSRPESTQLSVDSLKEVQNDTVKSHHDHDVTDKITIWILWLTLDPQGSLWKNHKVRFLFVDFSFLDVSGENTETPESLPKPTKPSEKCFFNYSSVVPVHTGRKELLRTLFGKPDFELLVFKVVSDSDSMNEVNYNCEDVGVAVVTMRKFVEQYNKHSFSIPVKNPENMAEIIGTLEVKIECTDSVFNF